MTPGEIKTFINELHGCDVVSFCPLKTRFIIIKDPLQFKHHRFILKNKVPYLKNPHYFSYYNSKELND
jgi:hypothetical protein